MADPEWRGGRYLVEGTNPRRGLAVARMGAHITYLSDAALHRKFGRKFQDRDNPTFSFDADFEVEVLSAPPGHHLRRALRRQFAISISRARWTISTSRPTTAACWPTRSSGTQTRFCVVSFTSRLAVSDRRNSRAIVHALNAAGARVSFAEIATDKGHDAFLLDEPELFAIVRGFLDGAAQGARPGVVG